MSGKDCLTECYFIVCRISKLHRIALLRLRPREVPRYVTYANICRCKYVYTWCNHLPMCVCIYMMHKFAYVCMYAYMLRLRAKDVLGQTHTLSYSNTHIRMLEHIHTHIQTHTHAYSMTHTHTHTHTHESSLTQLRMTSGGPQIHGCSQGCCSCRGIRRRACADRRVR
jgi:hypothetical protein